MTRNRKRDIERWVEDVESSDDGNANEVIVAYRELATGELTNQAGDRRVPVHTRNRQTA